MTPEQQEAVKADTDAYDARIEARGQLNDCEDACMEAHKKCMGLGLEWHPDTLLWKPIRS